MCMYGTHHMQQLSRAVVMYDAFAKQITRLKQELRGRAAQAAPAGVGGARHRQDR